MESPKPKIVECPRCHGLKFETIDSDMRGVAPSCPLCHGLGIVSPDLVCCCGAAGLYLLKEIQKYYCGDKRCRTATEMRATTVSDFCGMGAD